MSERIAEPAGIAKVGSGKLGTDAARHSSTLQTAGRAPWQDVHLQCQMILVNSQLSRKVAYGQYRRQVSGTAPVLQILANLMIGCTSCRDAKCKDTTFRAKSKPKACGCRLRNGKDPAAAGSRCATFKPHLIRDPDVLRAIRERSFVPKQCALITSAGGGQDCRACKQVKCPVDEHWHPPSDTGASESTATLPQQPDFGGVPELSRLGISSDNPQPGIDSPQAGFDTRAPFLPQQDFGDLGLNPEISSNFPLDTNLDFGKTRTIDTMANTHHTPSQQDSGNINWDDFLTLQYGEPDTALQSSGDPINPLPSRYNFYVGTNNFMAPSQPSQPHPGQQMMTPAVPLPSSSTPFWPQAQVLLEAPSTNTGLDRQALPSAAYRAQPQIPVQQQAQRQPPRTQLRIPHPQMMQRMPLQLGSVSNTSVRREPQIQIPAQQRSERRQPPVQQPSSAHQHYYRPQLTPQHNAQVPFYQHGPTITRDVRPGYFIDIGDLDQTIPLQQPILHQQQPAISSYHQRHPSASSSAISQANPNNSQLMVPSGSQHPRMPSQQHTQATPTNVPQDTYCYQYQQPANLQQPALPHHQQQAPASSRAFGSAPNRNESQQREDLRDLITPQQQQQQQRVTRSQSQTLPNSDTSQQPVSRQPTLATQPQKRAPPSSSSGSSYNNSPSGGSANDDDDGDEQHEAKEEERDNSKKKEKHKGKKTRT
ncbi:hypothetical protein QBC44DRAFT_367668 [Cladorrhinum sp. PSN332]|nr:hypothetical protein QBC44DRAFT_367668 [Cladorrhinum sp. PSN332]